MPGSPATSLHRSVTWALLASGCSAPEVLPAIHEDHDPEASWQLVADQGPEPGGNVIVFLLDDWGVDKFAPYGIHPDPVPSPVMEGLAASGVRFEAAWSEPTCSPTRAAALTGRNPTQTGIGRWIHTQGNPISLAQEETTIAELLKTASMPYETALTGKWHLRTWPDGESPADDVMLQGFDRQRGAMANPEMAYMGEGERGYYRWQKNTDGVFSYSETYMTIDTASEAVTFLQETDGPFFLWVAFNAPHLPLHRPPAELYDGPLSSDPTDAELYAAMVQAVDTEIGRVLDAMTEAQRASTTLFLLGDNGTAPEVMTDPSDVARSKGKVFDGGVRVPLVVTGPYVQAPGVSDALVQTTDLFATIAHVAGIDVSGAPGLDSLSFLPQVVGPDHPGARSHLLAERFHRGNEATAVRDRDYKLIQRSQDVEESLFRYGDGFDEGVDLLEAGELSDADAAALERLRDQLREQERWMRAHRDVWTP